jgi:type IV pilus assembly protein PilA
VCPRPIRRSIRSRLTCLMRPIGCKCAALIIAAIAIPNLLRARISANESSAASSVRTTNTAQVSFFSTYPATGYSGTMAALGPPAQTGCPATGPVVASACLIDWTLSQATVVAAAKSGYIFNMGNPAGGPPNLGYTVGGAPGRLQPERCTWLLRYRRRGNLL